MSYEVLPKCVSAQPTPAGDVSVHCFVWSCSCHPAAFSGPVARKAQHAGVTLDVFSPLSYVRSSLPYSTLSTLLTTVAWCVTSVRTPWGGAVDVGWGLGGPVAHVPLPALQSWASEGPRRLQTSPPRLLARPADWSCLPSPALEARASPFPPHLPVWFDIAAYFHAFAFVGAIPLVWRTLLQFSTW